ncbi:hypothetical protein D9619_012053 [Psilocybe cf. subviscida]|uniref:WSC domain-containing protein n=1 Tax=Psilocybe cf. subviscida TaxID=2480587 RepID=A0A8H5B7J9_9AGAR|nr:hypothetical protein D9619_012053 [Psilocybe cf. subviscida]
MKLIQRFAAGVVSILLVGQSVRADSWTSLGCFSDSMSSRALGAASLLNQPSFTLTQCTNFCGSYKYVGIENGKDCYCANTINPSSTNIGQESCNVICTGQFDTYCGGLNAIQIFRHDVPPPIVWNSIGCYTDSTSSRTLRTASFTSVNNMTVAACKSYCAGYPYAGVEYARVSYLYTIIYRYSSTNDTFYALQSLNSGVL